jgi:hypothetical protein
VESGNELKDVGSLLDTARAFFYEQIIQQEMRHILQIKEVARAAWTWVYMMHYALCKSSA